MIYFTSDLHLMHDRRFIWEARGFKSVEEMCEAIVKRWNEKVAPEDTVYILGDLMLNDNEKAFEYLKQLNGRFHIIRGNHDTDNRVELYSKLPQFIDIKWADMLKHEGFHFYLSHFPTLTANLDKEYLKQMTLNIFGHTHSKLHFYEDRPTMYNVAMDAHDCTPVSIVDIEKEMYDKMVECKAML